MRPAKMAMALALTVLMGLSTIGAPVAAQEVVADPRQPSPDNPHMHVFGSDDLANCFMHFDGNDTSGSAADGYGEKVWNGQNARIEVDYTCRMESFKQDMYNSENGSISVHLEFEIESQSECQDTDAQCKNLTLTFYKGGFEVAQEVFMAISTNGDTFSVDWNIQIDENMTRFNKSEEPQIQIEFNYPGYSDIICGLLNSCGGSFRMYYHTPDNPAAEIEFPVVNQTMPDGADEDDTGGLIGGVTDSVPGFGLIAGIGSLAMAAVASSRRSKED